LGERVRVRGVFKKKNHPHPVLLPSREKEVKRNIEKV
jgi:hypothetical protein